MIQRAYECVVRRRIVVIAYFISGEGEESKRDGLLGLSREAKTIESYLERSRF